MNYLITAAGYGSRFLKRGIKPPKPLIRVLGRELLLWSLQSFPIGKDDNLYIVVLRSHQVKARLDATIRFLYPDTRIEWLEIEDVLNGQLITALTTVQHFGLVGPTVIHNCDTYHDATKLDFSFFLSDPSCFGLIPCFLGEGSHWSFVRTESASSDLALEVTEKERISDLCSVGTYAFTDARSLVTLASQYLSEVDQALTEYFIAPLYNYAIQKGLSVRVCSAESTRLYGTPEELLTTFQISHYQLLAENAWDAHQRGTLVVDIDGTLCGGAPNGDYTAVQPIESVCEALRRAHSNGIYIVLLTARNMRTFKGSLGLINKYTAPVLAAWLHANDIPYDEIYYGKPWGHDVSYIDDKSVLIGDFVNMHCQ